MRIRLVTLLMAIIMVLGAIPVSAAPLWYHDKDGDGEAFVLSAESKTILDTDTSVSIGIKVLENTGTWAVKFFVLYDNELSLDMESCVTAGDSFDPLSPVEPDFTDVPSSEADAADADYLWMLENLGIKNGDWKVASFYSECEQWDDTYTTAKGKLCDLEFKIDSESEKRQYTVRLIPVYGYFVRDSYSGSGMFADDVIEIFDPIGYDATIKVGTKYDPDGDGKAFAIKAEDKKILKTDTSVSVGLDVLENTGTYSAKFFVLYDNELSLDMESCVTAGDSFEPLNPVEPEFTDVPSSEADAKDIDYLWMLDILGIENGDWKVASFDSECDVWAEEYTAQKGRLCNLNFEIDPDSKKDYYTVKIVPVIGCFILYCDCDMDHVEEIFDPVGFDGIIEVENNCDPDGDGKSFAVKAESKTVIETDTSVSVGFDVLANTGTYEAKFLVLYDTELSLATDGHIPVGDSFEQFLPFEVDYSDVPSSEAIASDIDCLMMLENTGLENGGWKVASLYSECAEWNAPCENTGRLFDLDFEIDPESEKDFYTVKIIPVFGYFYREWPDGPLARPDCMNEIFDPVGFDGRIDVLDCPHSICGEWVILSESGPFSYGEKANYCSLCGREVQREKIPMTTEDFGLNPDNESGFITGLPVGLSIELFVLHYKDMGINFCYTSSADRQCVATGDFFYWEDRCYVLAISGDLSGDGTIGAKDVIDMKKLLTGALNVEGEVRASADIDGDGRVNAKDSYALRMLIANH